MEPVNPTGKVKRIKSSNNRVKLDPETLAVLAQHTKALEDRFGALVSMTTRQLANFLLQNRAGELTAQELNLIKTRYTDRVKVLQSILERARDARKEGRTYSIEEEIKIFETLGVTEKVTSGKGRRQPKERRKGSPTSGTEKPDPVTSEASKTTPEEVLKGGPEASEKVKNPETIRAENGLEIRR
jgi:hypothetical protein